MGMFGQRTRERLKAHLSAVPGADMLPVDDASTSLAERQPSAPPDPNSFFVSKPVERNWWKVVGAGLGDMGDALLGGPGGYSNKYAAEEMGMQEKADWETYLDGAGLDDTTRAFAKDNPVEFRKQRYEKEVKDAERRGKFQSIIDMGEAADPLSRMYAEQDPDKFLSTRFTDSINDGNYDRTREDTITDRDLLHEQAVAAEELKANRPRIDNTGQAIIRTDPVTGESKVLYRDPQQAGASAKTFRPMTKEELAARGYPKNATGQIDSNGRAYVDKPAKAQSMFSQTEIRGFREKADGLMTLGNAVQQYMDALKVTSPKMFEDKWDQDGVNRLKSAHGLITSAIKDADSLGALDQGVQNLVNSIVSNPIDWSNLGRSSEAIGKQAKELFDSIDYRLGRIPDEYRGGATSNTTMWWKAKYRPEQIEQAQRYLKAWDSLPANLKQQYSKAKLEEVANYKPPSGGAPSSEFEDDVTDDEYDSALNGEGGEYLDEAPPGVEQDDWDELTDEEKLSFIEEAAGQ